MCKMETNGSYYTYCALRQEEKHYLQRPASHEREWMTAPTVTTVVAGVVRYSVLVSSVNTLFQTASKYPDIFSSYFCTHRAWQKGTCSCCAKIFLSYVSVIILFRIVRAMIGVPWSRRKWLRPRHSLDFNHAQSMC